MSKKLLDSALGNVFINDNGELIVYYDEKVLNILIKEGMLYITFVSDKIATRYGYYIDADKGHLIEITNDLNNEGQVT